MLAVTDKNVDGTSEEIIRYCNALRNGDIRDANSLQALSQVLALGETSAGGGVNLDSEMRTELNCQRALKIFNELRSAKCNLSNNGLTFAGVLAHTAIDTEKIIDETAELCSYLIKNGGFAFRNMDIYSRSVITAFLVADNHTSGTNITSENMAGFNAVGGNTPDFNMDSGNTSDFNMDNVNITSLNMDNAITAGTNTAGTTTAGTNAAGVNKNFLRMVLFHSIAMTATAQKTAAMAAESARRSKEWEERTKAEMDDSIRQGWQLNNDI